MNKIILLFPIIADTNEIVVYQIKDGDNFRWTALTSTMEEGEQELSALVRTLHDKSGIKANNIALGKQRYDLPLYQTDQLVADLLLFQVTDFEVIDMDKFKTVSLQEYRRMIDQEDVDFTFYTGYYLIMNSMLR